MAVFPSIKIEGGLLGPDLLDQVVGADVPGQKPADFGLDGKRNLTDEIAATFADARALWGVFQNRLQRLSDEDVATTVTRDAWMIPFLGLLGFAPTFNQRAYEIDGLSFAISHRADEGQKAPPVHVVGYRQELGRVPASGRPRLAPHSLVQEYLNRTENLWGLVTNGRILRLLRDCSYIRRQAYVEFDLQTMLEEQRFQDFAALYRLLHRTRLPRTDENAADCLLEKYYVHSIEQGGRVRDHLRDGVEQCILRLANGFLRHPASDDLRRRVAPDCADNDRITPEDFYRQLLRLVYRFLFLLVSEDRGLLSTDPLYREHYGVARLRRLLDNRASFTDHDDLWQSLRVLWYLLNNDTRQPLFNDQPMAAALGLPVLNGELFAGQPLDSALISNFDLLDAFFYLAKYEAARGASWQRVNYAALDVEELGSVYESLLEFHPAVQRDAAGRLMFDLVVEGRERRSTGSHYTPPELVAPLIQHTLEPVLADRLRAANTPRQKEAAILALKVCDPACGSGHFLLAAARRLGKELARVRTGEDEPAPERVREAIRDVVTHCIHGVDKNPLAVELCRVALWLECHESGKPLTFLDHRIRCGDSLVGVFDLQTLADGVPDEAFKPVGSDDRTAAREARRRNAEERRHSLLNVPFADQLANLGARLAELDRLPEDTIEQVRAKADACRAVEARPEFRRLKAACDVWTAAFFQPFPTPARQPLTTSHVRTALTDGELHDPRLDGFVFQAGLERRFFHWPLAFPDVFAAGGFDVILGNPPFMGGLRISGAFGDKYRNWLTSVFDPFTGTADLCAAFFRRAFESVKRAGRFGMIATNTIGQGDTRESGLARIARSNGVIVFAQRFVKWPGRANVEVNLVAVARAESPAPSGPRLGHDGARPSVPAHRDATQCVSPGGLRAVGAADRDATERVPPAPLLDGVSVPFISSRLDAEPEAEPKRLAQNEGKAFIGDYVRGIGFVLEPAQAEALLAKDPRNADCLFPYLNGEDLNSHPEQQPTRWVICFHDWPLERAQEYPDLLRIVEERVRAERERLRGPGDARNRQYWWQFAAYRVGMRRAIAPLNRVLARSRIAEMHAVIFVQNGWVYNEKTIVFAFDDDYHFALLQSSLHETWLRRFTSTLRTDINYAPTDCFDTFPFPPPEYQRAASGEQRAEDMPEALQRAAQVGGEYHEHRRQIMLARNLGLTKTYNLFHDPACTDAYIVRLRELHAEMDRAILACYAWDDLDLHHGFYQNDRGQPRFTISRVSRREILRRLLDLNLRLAR